MNITKDKNLIIITENGTTGQYVLNINTGEFLGKKGKLTAVLRGMGALTPEERPIIGQLANEVRAMLEEGIEVRKKAILDEVKRDKLRNEIIDVTLPGKRKDAGKLHPLAKVSRDRYITEMAKEYPQYGFEKHKGYGTKDHMEALRTYGPSPIHRKKFIRFLEDETK